MNTKQPTSERVSQLAVLIPGMVGAAVIVRALGVYLHEDQVAAFIIAMMGLGFVAGIVELVLRNRRAYALAREVDALPRKATDTTLDKVSAPLKAFLRARIEHAAAPPSGENLTPYLVGLMVMLGLLGTLLGLFETLHGAGQALTASTDVNALRDGLSAPMRGLTRSFGCSAAGVSASAMLGLASVFARRAEAMAWTRAQGYAMGPLRELSPMRRQLDAFQLLTEQGQSLPRAATALEQASGVLGQLAERWETAHKSSQEAQRKSTDELMERMQEALARSASETGRSLASTVEPLLKEVLAQTGDALTRQLAATRDALDRELEARREADKAMREGMREEMLMARQVFERELEARREADNVAREAMQEERLATHKTLDRELDARREADKVAREAMQEERLATHKALDRELEARREADAAMRDATREEMQASLRAFDQDLEARREAEQALRDGMREELSHTRLESQEHLTTLAAAARTLVQQLEEEGRARRAEADRLLGELADKFDANAAQRAEASQRELTALSELSMQLVANSEAREQGLTMRWAALVDRIQEDFGKLTEKVETDFGGRSERDRALSDAVSQSVSALRGSAEGLFSLINKQESVVEELVARNAEQLKVLGAEAHRGAQAALEQLVRLGDEHATRFTQLSDEHAMRFAELEELLKGTQSQHTQALATELTTHAERLGKGLESTTQLVHEAATVLRASSVEMGAVAGLFHQSVERQREAAQTWMESLGELEGAVERAGRGAAADALGDQLASTQEVFARQLQFQRELFEQLRTLRSGNVASVSKGEQDVSA